MIVWAKSNGNWTTASIWAFWNETTQQIEDYGQVPQSDDIVYLNNYIVDVNLVNTSLIEAAEIHNDLNPYTNQSGGYIDLLNNTTNDLTLTINANIIGNGTTSTQSILRCGVDASPNRKLMNMIINGIITNAYISNDQRFQNISVVNGNVTDTLWYSRHAATGAVRSLTINGNFSNSRMEVSNNGGTTLTINGRVTDIATSLIIGNAGKTCNVNGYIKFSSGNNFIHNIGVNGVADMSGLSADENLPMPFLSGYGLIKRTDLTLIAPHLTDYPAKNNVKEGVSYAFDTMVGTYLPDYPPESVVLKDYEYGDGDDRKTGTMPVLSQQLISRLENCATVETVQQLLVAHLDN